MPAQVVASSAAQVSVDGSGERGGTKECTEGRGAEGCGQTEETGIGGEGDTCVGERCGDGGEGEREGRESGKGSGMTVLF